MDLQWLQAHSTNNEWNTSKYVWNINFPVITHKITGCYGQKFVTMGTQWLIFYGHELPSTNNE